MRLVRLLGAAAKAESLLLRRQGVSLGRSTVLRGAALGFGAVAVAMLYVAGWIWLKDELGATRAALVLAGINGAVMAGLFWMAKDRRDPVAEEALRLRDQSLAEIAAPQSLSLESLALRVGSALMMNMMRR